MQPVRMDLELRTADPLDIDPGVEGVDVAVSTAQVAHGTDLVAELRARMREARPAARIAVAAFGPSDRVEPFAYLAGALQAVVGAPASPRPIPAASGPTDPSVLRRRMEEAGASEVRVVSTTRRVRFASARQLVEAVTACDPTAARRWGELTAWQTHDVVHVLDGMFRDRSGGRPDAVLDAVVNVGTGRVRGPEHDPERDPEHDQR